MALADENDLHLQRDRLRLQRDGADHAVDLAQRLDDDLLLAQGALQPLPGERLGQQLERLDDQIAAVGLVQRPRLDEREVGDQRAHLGHVLDAADQLGVARLIEDDDRRARGLAVIDGDVDLVARRRHAPLGRGDAQRRPQQLPPGRLLILQEGLEVLHDVGLHGVEVSADGVQVGVLLAQFVQQGRDTEADDALVQFAQPRLHLALELGHLLHDALQRLL